MLMNTEVVRHTSVLLFHSIVTSAGTRQIILVRETETVKDSPTTYLRLLCWEFDFYFIQKCTCGSSPSYYLFILSIAHGVLQHSLSSSHGIFKVA